MTRQNKIPQQFYSLNEVKQLMKRANISMSTFYRLAAKAHIEKHLAHGQQRGASYNKIQVDELIEGSTSRKGVNRKQTQRVTSVKPQQEHATTDWIRSEDLPYIFALDYELYGEANTVSPLVTGLWWQKNPFACRILFDKENRKDIWGAFTILPMEEEVIYRLLSEDLLEKDITPDLLLSYEAGGEYSGYIASLAVRPERRPHLLSLITSVLNFWYEQYPTIQLKKLYAFALGAEEGESDGLRMIRKLYFAPRYDIGENAWELRLDHYNPSSIIQQFQKRLTEKPIKRKGKLMITPPSELYEKGTLQPDIIPATFRHACTREDIAATVEIEGQIFDSAGPDDDFYVDLWYSWLQKNPETFYVLELHGHIVAFVSILPLQKDKIERILREEETPSNITADDIQVFQPDTPYNIYIHVMGVRPEYQRKEKSAYGMRLLMGLSEVFEKLGQKGIIIRALYARSRKEDGVQLSRHIGFREMKAPPEVDKHLFVLEVDRRSDVVFLDDYPACLREILLHEKNP